MDTTPPTATATALPAPNGAGWNNTDVTVSFSGTDPGGSGVASCSAAVVLSAEGAGQSESGTCTDNAGNTSAPASATDINIDKTAPSVSLADHEVLSTVPLAVNYPAPVVTDALDAGPAVVCVPASGSMFALGDTLVTCTATDQAGNAEQDMAVVSVLTTDAVIEDVQGEIDDLLAAGGLSNKAVNKLGKAQDKLNDALDELAEDPPDVKKALQRISDAVKQLSKAGDAGADVDALIDLLVEMARVQAQDAIDTAIATPGANASRIAKAEAEMAKALDDLDPSDFDPDKAIDHYAKAWQHAHKALP
ncbi:MAG: HYR domain-containing protein [Acidimicrobiia bacterium]|nr:HYR domain-containing protein [Acidimicrobiia bacterium]